ncbi:uncharacterized protein ARMOST_19106 [Armillaria ostoyae]|uniref:Uncharacterized protein n=1 Tax=Armillaria ostoyae TaxID=47428 RepID=A0A284S3P2_ARMOS|nr:uncharacterized protein ARMOST_19106 [Armillaria ostoyae]
MPLKVTEILPNSGDMVPRATEEKGDLKDARYVN